MEKQQFLEQSRSLIADAEVGKALDLAEGFLKDDIRYRKLFKEAIRLSSQHSKTKQDELKGTISFDNAKLSYSQVNDGLLHLLEYIENDDLDPPALHRIPTLQSVYQSNKWLFLAGLPTLVLAIAVLVLVSQFKDDDGPQSPLPPPPEDCAIKFTEQAFPKILVLPFFRPTGDQIQPDGLIVERLEDFSNQLHLATDVEICSPFEPNKLLNYDEADTLGRRNFSDLIIWGRAEKAEDDFLLKTRYKYLGEQDTLPVTNLKWQGEKQVEKVKVLSLITSSGELTSDIEATILLVLGLVAEQSGNSKAAMAALEKSQVTDSAGVMLKNMLLAETYLQNNQHEKALLAYDTLLQVHPNYWLAENNRGVLKAASEDYLGAITDFSDVLDKRPDDAETLLARGMAYKMSEQLKQAVDDLSRYLEISPEKSEKVETELRQTKEEVRSLERKVEQTRDKPITTLNRREVKEAAEASRKLGENERAGQFTEKALLLDPDDPKNIANYIELRLRKGDTVKAKEVLDDAVRRGVKKEEILKQSKVVRRHFERQ